MNEQQLRDLRADFYAAVGMGHRQKAHRIAKVLARETTGDEHRRWQRWIRATGRGHRVKVGTFPAEVIAGDDLAAVEEARGFLGDDRRVADAMSQLREAE